MHKVPMLLLLKCKNNRSHHKQQPGKSHSNKAESSPNSATTPGKITLQYPLPQRQH